jgi:hypothetical protein
MRVFAYCAESFAGITKRAAGVTPLTSPPVSAATFQPAQLHGYDLLYFDLHGKPNDSQWYGDFGLPALTAQQIESSVLDGALVFAANCYLADEQSPMLDALLKAGARYVFAGDGTNYSDGLTMTGVSLLGRAFRLSIEFGVEPLRALTLAKRVVGLSRPLSNKDTVRDTLAFRAYERKAA